MDLTDHFGTEPVLNLYGPKTNIVGHVIREGVLGADTPITPIDNFTKEIVPDQVVAGELDNTSYDASKIIKPEIARPKFDIKQTITHEAVVTTPVHQGTQYEQYQTQSMNRVTGQISRKVTQIEKPIIGQVKHLRQVTSENETLVDIGSGKIIDMTKRPTYHGQNPLIADRILIQ